MTKTRQIFWILFVILCVSCSTLPQNTPTEYSEPKGVEEAVATLSGRITYYLIYGSRLEVVAIDDMPLAPVFLDTTVRLLSGKHKIDVRYMPLMGPRYWATLGMPFVENHDYQLQFEKLDGERKAVVPLFGEVSFPRRQVCVLDKTKNVVVNCEEAYVGGL